MAKKILRSEFLKVLESRISVSKRIMEEERDQVWNNCRDFYEGRHWPKSLSHRLHTINLIWAVVRTQLASLYFRNPDFTLKPKKPEFEGPLQKLHEAILNYWIQKSYLKSIAKLCVQSTFTDLAIITWGCDTKFKAGRPNTSLRQDNPTDQPIPETESFYFQKVRPEYFFPDHSTDEQVFEKLPGFGVQEIMRKDDVVSRYGANPKDIEPNFSTVDLDAVKRRYREANRGAIPADVSDDLKRVLVYKYYDNEKQKLFIWPKDHEDFLDVIDYEDDPPYAVLKYDERSEGFYPSPEIEHLVDPQKIIEIAMSMASEHMKRSARKLQAPKGILDPEAKANLENPAAGILIELAKPDFIKPVDMGNADSSIFANAATFEAFFNQICGLSTAKRGGDATRITATAEAIMDKYNMNRSSDRLSLTSDWMVKTANKFMNCLQRNLLVPDVMKITDEQGGMMWAMYIPTLDLVGDYECEVRVGETAPKDDALERAQWIECIKTLFVNPAILASPRLVEETMTRFNIDSPQLRDEVVKLGQLLITQQMGLGGMGGGGQGASQAGPMAGANLKGT